MEILQLLSDKITIKETGAWSTSCTFANPGESGVTKLLGVTTLSKARFLPNGVKVYTNNKRGVDRVTLIVDDKTVKIECSRAQMSKFEGALAHVLLGLKHLPVIVQYEFIATTLVNNPNAKYIKKVLKVGSLFWIVAQVDLTIITQLLENQSKCQ